MRIAQVMAGAPHGGAETFFERLSCALAAAGEDVLPVIRCYPPRAARLRAAGLAPIELTFGGPLDIFTRRALRRALSAFAPAVVIAWMKRAAHFTSRGSWTLLGRLGGYYDLTYYRHCDHLIANTHGIVRWIREQGWPAERVHYLPNFVPDLAAIKPAPLPGHGPRLLALGRFHRMKGFDVAIRALRHLPQAHLCLAGSGPEAQALIAVARQAGVGDRVSFLGWHEDVGGLLAACDVFLCPSRHEPLGNVVLEAWSAARPVVAAAVQGPAELIEDGKTGLLVPPDAPEELAAAIASLLADPVRAAAIAMAGRRVYERNFSQPIVVAEWRRCLAALASP